MTGGRTYTNVNKHIAKARARVRLSRLNENCDLTDLPGLSR